MWIIYTAVVLCTGLARQQLRYICRSYTCYCHCDIYCTQEKNNFNSLYKLIGTHLQLFSVSINDAHSFIALVRYIIVVSVNVIRSKLYNVNTAKDICLYLNIYMLNEYLIFYLKHPSMQAQQHNTLAIAQIERFPQNICSAWFYFHFNHKLH